MTETLAAVLLGFFAAGYFVLGGADIGAGMLLPFLGRDGGERRQVVAAIVPFFLADEVWLVATAGLLIGAFPDAEARLLPGLLPLVVALLAGWIVRDMGLWTRNRAGGRVWPAVCDTAVTLGSWTVAGSWAWLLAGLFTGSTSVARGADVVLLAGLVVALFVLHGLAFARLRLTGRAYERARAVSGGAGDRATFAVTATLAALLPVAAGARLDLTGSAADGATLDLLVPAVYAMLPLLLAGQVLTWWTFRERVTA
ncbi:cytochrome d ubiquinol oxidase subunit II [Jiangella anatolica]|uniref:Cytochrome BD oxidase subunit II n=1 Tax=Jiangella anatolica TaxID=2670374 RepID=A0A2W2C7E4_9ACTN|nr:cytochrome d ubiquinol oxidase subunit II [Jiangella anatolica]PZF81656.1 cytochrome BD oxidase subunit II [Jiangella anatolica]